MNWIRAAAAAGAAFAISCGAWARPLLHDPVELNIGVSCQWQAHCMVAQRAAMKRALAYVSARRPPHWKVQLCNRNAARGSYRVDWVGFDNCIRNGALKGRTRSGRRRAGQ